MAYADRNPATNRNALTAGAVALLEAAVVLALIKGLAVTFTPHAPPPRTTGILVPLPAPPAPPPTAQPDERVQQQTHITAPREAALPLAGEGGGITVLPTDPGPAATPLPDPDLILPSPSPSPSFAPRALRPKNDPHLWVSESDYPSRDLREGHQGVVRFSLAIAANGKVQSCAVIASSGFPGLDAATCEAVSRRARFDPARDGGGAAAGGSYTGSIRWVIPD